VVVVSGQKKLAIKKLNGMIDQRKLTSKMVPVQPEKVCQEVADEQQ